MNTVEGEIGFVSKIINDKALIRLIETDACDECKAKILCKPNITGIREVTALNKAQAQIGERVRIVESGNLLLIFSFFQFAVPLLGLLSGIFLAHGLQFSFPGLPAEVTLALFGLLGLITGGFVAWLWAKNKSKTAACVFEIDFVYPPNQEPI